MKIGKKEIDMTFISADRVTRSADMYNKAVKERVDNKESDYVFTKKIVKVAVFLIHAPVINIPDIGFFKWLKRNLIYSGLLMKTVKFDDLDDFLSEALEPILGSKKKEISKQNAAMEAGQKVVEVMEPEELKALLQNFVALTDGQKTTVTGD